MATRYACGFSCSRCSFSVRFEVTPAEAKDLPEWNEDGGDPTSKIRKARDAIARNHSAFCGDNIKISGLHPLTEGSDPLKNYERAVRANSLRGAATEAAERDALEELRRFVATGVER